MPRPRQRPGWPGRRLHHCPNQAGPVDNQGCPSWDTDGDGVLDRADNCPTEPGPAENQGCQAKQMVTISSTKLEITEKVFFKTGSAEIDPRSFPLLKNIAQVIVVHPEISGFGWKVTPTTAAPRRPTSGSRIGAPSQ